MAIAFGKCTIDEVYAFGRSRKGRIYGCHAPLPSPWELVACNRSETQLFGPFRLGMKIAWWLGWWCASRVVVAWLGDPVLQYAASNETRDSVEQKSLAQGRFLRLLI